MRKVKVGWVEGLQAHVTAEDQAQWCPGSDYVPSAHVCLPRINGIRMIRPISREWHRIAARAKDGCACSLCMLCSRPQ